MRSKLHLTRVASNCDIHIYTRQRCTIKLRVAVSLCRFVAATMSPKDEPFRSPVGCTAAGSHDKEKAFVEWCAQERVRFPSSRLAVLPATGRALVASRSIRQGEVVVELPDGAVLMAENCGIADVLEEEGMCKPADEEILEIQGLIIAVMYERCRGAESRWAPYLDLLPQGAQGMQHMPLYWKRHEFRELRGTAAYDKMMGRVQHPSDAPTTVPMLWAEVVGPFVSEHPELGLPGGEEGYELYRWATSAVASYSFILGDDKYQAMVPVWDLLNHITGQVNVRLNHCARRHVLQMIATRDIAAGEELVNNYGELSNAELLRGYGFVEARNANNHVQVPLGFVVQACHDVLAQRHAGSSSKATAAKAAAAAATNAHRASSNTPNGFSNGAGHIGAGGEVSSSPAFRPLLRRYCLCRRLGLLPLQAVFKVYGGGRPPPSAMTAVVRILLAREGQVRLLRRALKRAMRKRKGRGRKGRKGKQQGQGKVASEKEVAAAVMRAVGLVLDGEDGKGGMGQGQGTGMAECVAVYEHIVRRMLGRYTCGLEEDERLLGGGGEGKQEQQQGGKGRRKGGREDGGQEGGGGGGALPPRRRAAVLARKPEKEALLSLQAFVRQPGALRRAMADPAAGAGPRGAAAGRGSSRGGFGQVGGDGGKQGPGEGGGGEEKRRRGAGVAGVGEAATGAGAEPFAFGFAL